MPKDSLKDRIDDIALAWSTREYSILDTLVTGQTKEELDKQRSIYLEQLAHPDLRAKAAHLATSLESMPLDSDEMEKLFAKFGLDHRDPFAWGIIVRSLAMAMFFKRRTGGQPRKWDSRRWCKLLADFGSTVRGSKTRRKRSEADVCAQLAKAHRDYAGLSASTIQRELQNAKDPRQNSILADRIKNVSETISSMIDDGKVTANYDEVPRLSFQIALTMLRGDSLLDGKAH